MKNYICVTIAATGKRCYINKNKIVAFYSPMDNYAHNCATIIQCDKPEIYYPIQENLVEVEVLLDND